MELKDLIGPVISVVSIFLSNLLGRMTTKEQYKLQTLEKTYLNYYVPLMKLLTSANNKSLTFYWLVATWYIGPAQEKSNSRTLINLLQKNLELLPPKIALKVSDFSVNLSGSELFFGKDGYRENYRERLIAASEIFDEIIITSLKEASKISKTLGYPNIAKPILDTFLGMEQNQYNHPRYLPEIYQTNMPRVFEGDEPPYY